ncbi:flagellin [Candidatus Marinarcus aquaticus]|uniref:Flagellin n=1 Tax=Candidatus Marinarcus aquaticus TaxID=2044504 RepID=A0A4Q0XPT0_9BACT|nr:flagellin [Candidatus Marinarcus aquaticus]RXJ56257.1 flagellin [Candidatus Marinarcus aquaticus]
MELGRIAEIDQSKVNTIEKTQKVRETDNNQKIDPNEQHKNTKANEIVTDTNEVIIDNVQFGYNKSSQDFFVKVTRGNAEYKYPTEDMMKIKAQLLEAMKAEQE